MYQYEIRVTLKTNNGIFKPTSTSEEFSFCARSENEAIDLASKNVPSRGYPHDEKQVQVLNAIPIAEAAERELINELAALNRQTIETIKTVREATQVVNELTRVFEAA